MHQNSYSCFLFLSECSLQSFELFAYLIPDTSSKSFLITMAFVGTEKTRKAKPPVPSCGFLYRGRASQNCCLQLHCFVIWLNKFLLKRDVRYMAYSVTNFVPLKILS